MVHTAVIAVTMVVTPIIRRRPTASAPVVERQVSTTVTAVVPVDTIVTSVRATTVAQAIDPVVQATIVLVQGCVQLVPVLSMVPTTTTIHTSVTATPGIAVMLRWSPSIIPVPTVVIPLEPVPTVSVPVVAPAVRVTVAPAPPVIPVN